MPAPTLSADCEAGTSSAPQVAGSAPSAWTRNPKRFVFWFDQITPILLPGIATTALMSSSLMSVARFTGPVNELYGESA